MEGFKLGGLNRSFYVIRANAFFGSTILTAFNDNAAITFLASQVPAFDHNLVEDVALAKSLQYAVVAGAVTEED